MLWHLRITKTGINPLESIRAEPAVMLPVAGIKKYTTPCLSGLCMLYIEKKKLFVQLQLIWICSSVCVLSHIHYYAFFISSVLLE